MSLQPAQYDLTIWRNGTFRKRFYYLTGGQGSTPKDLTGHTAKLTIRDRQGGATIYSLSTEDGRIILGGTAGTIELIVPLSDASALDWRGGVYVLTITAPNGDTDPLLTGRIVVRGV